MAEPLKSVEPLPAEERSEVDELREELAHSRQEVLRLRDLLIGRDAEVGTLRGRVVELEEGAARLLVIAAQLRARLLGLIRTPGALLRRLRRSRD